MAIAIGRSAADAPEIDGVVRIEDGAALHAGRIRARDDRARRKRTTSPAACPLILPIRRSAIGNPLMASIFAAAGRSRRSRATFALLMPAMLIAGCSS